MIPTLTPERANRLAIGFARSRGIPYDQAEQLLKKLTLRLIVTGDAGNRPADQAAILTALNTAHRAFLGGVELQMNRDIPLRLPLSGLTTLDEALALIGYTPVALTEPTSTIYIGTPPETAAADDVRVYCDSWRAGASDAGAPADFIAGDADEFALGGIMAGALAVHRCFVRATGLPAKCLDGPFGLSLWNPHDDWRQPVTTRRLYVLPIRFWMLGLGHLGQAFLWTLALLPHLQPGEVEFMLHDFDFIEESNQGSGLLCRPDSVRKKKARQCAEWLERLGFSTAVTERRFSAVDRRSEDEPAIAFCGFDRVAPRLHLDMAGFDLVIECGLGGSLADFDQIELHSLPSCHHTAQSLWSRFPDRPICIDPVVAGLFGGTDQICGALAIDVAGKSVSTSFVGAIAATLSVAELLRTFNRGSRFDRVFFDVRGADVNEFIDAGERLTAAQLGRIGFKAILLGDPERHSDRAVA